MRENSAATLEMQENFFHAAVFGKKDLLFLADEKDENSRRQKEKVFLAQYHSIPRENIFFLEQVHGTASFHIDESSLKQNHATFYSTGDAMFTTVPNALLCIRTADCMSVFFTASDGGRHLAGIIHAGWKGLKDGIITKTLLHAAESCRFKTGDFNVFFGPSAGGDVYQVQEDVARFFPLKKKNPDNSYMLDLKENAAHEIDNYHIAETSFFNCTMKRNNIFFSHRKGDAGRNLNVIMLKG